MKSVTGIIFSSIQGTKLGELTSHRCTGSIPVVSNYRLIDFPLSNFSLAGMDHVGIVTQSNYQSLMEHVGNGSQWDLMRKQGGLVLLPPYGRVGSGGIYQGKIEAFDGIMGYLKDTGSEYVLSVDCDFLANIDYKAFVDYHLANQADITVMYKRAVVQADSSDVSAIEMNQDGNVEKFFLNPTVGTEQNIYMKVVIMSRHLLEQLVHDNVQQNQLSFTRDILQNYTSTMCIAAMEYTGYVGWFDSLRQYYQTNMDLLNPDVRKTVFSPDSPIYTSSLDVAPVRYGVSSHVSGSLVAEGCEIDGCVENSILFDGVRVEKGAVVKNCILMRDTDVGKDSQLDYVITDKRVVVSPERRLSGVETYPVYISKGAHI